MPKKTLNALVPIAGGTELALPDDLINKARDYAENAYSERTRQEYARCWRHFRAWCEQKGREALPAGIDTLAAYITAAAHGDTPSGRPLAIQSITQAMAAIKLMHEQAGTPLNTKHPVLTQVWRGIRREIAKSRPVRRVKPLMFKDLGELLQLLRPDVLREARDAAVVALACAGALRRSELVGLDWASLGSGTGYLTVDDAGLTVRLMTSKASQETAQDIAIPRSFAPLICAAIEAWANVAKLQPGSPVFTKMLGGNNYSTGPQSGHVGVVWNDRHRKWVAIYKKKYLRSYKTVEEAYAAYCAAAKDAGTQALPSGTRMRPQTVALIVKQRMRQLIEARNKKRGAKKLTREEMDAQVAMYSGHSPRVGYVTSAAENDIPSHRIRQQTRHKTEAMVSVYIRDVDIRKNSGLKGVGF